MFELAKAINHFNRLYHKKIPLDKSWKLTYLQPDIQAFLDQAHYFIHHSVYYASPFTQPRQILRKKLKTISTTSLTEMLPTLHTMIDYLKKDHQLYLRLQWEERLTKALYENDRWQAILKQIENKTTLFSLGKKWKEYAFFQYHSSEGLLFLLDVIVIYQDHFRKAQQELGKNQRSWMKFFRIPSIIAKDYQKYLFLQETALNKWHKKTIGVLLFRLKVAEQAGQVIFDDPSYYFLQYLQSLKTELNIKKFLVNEPFLRKATLFHKMHQVIEQWGDVDQKAQLYQLDWYQQGVENRQRVHLLKKDKTCLWIPKPLTTFFPQYGLRFFSLFTFIRQRFTFLESQQALLAQWLLCRKWISSTLKTHSPTLSLLFSFLLCEQLIQEALINLSIFFPCHRWAWFTSRFQKAWLYWLHQNMSRNRAVLYQFLSNYCDSLFKKNADYNPDQLQKFIHKMEVVFRLHEENLSPLLISFQQRLQDIKSWQQEQEKQMIYRDAEEKLLKEFKQEITQILYDYEKYYESKRQTISKARQDDIVVLRTALRASTGKEFYTAVNQHYQTMYRSVFAKLNMTFDGSILRHQLRALLDNPKYQVFVGENTFQTNIEKSIPDINFIGENKENFVDCNHENPVRVQDVGFFSTPSQINALQEKLNKLVENGQNLLSQ